MTDIFAPKYHGVLYEGPPDGSGNSWTTIDMPDHVAGGEVRSTIPHSTMGELIVGNYDLLGFEGKFNAFIYDMRTTKYHRLNLKLQTGIVPRLVTAYGVWQNHKDSYTIAGGLFDGSGLNVGYLVDYDSLKHGQTIVPAMFSFDNMPDVITHFEGITKYGEETTKFGPRYYSLAATGDQSTTTQGGAAFAVVERLPDGSFGEAFWKRVQATSSGITTGNTVLTNNLFGIYTTTGSHSFHSYVMGTRNSYIKGHLVETNTSRSQVQNATSYIEHHQSPSEHEKVWSQIGNNWQRILP
jgi:hypothetical protein